jgi:hypothetical protein
MKERAWLARSVLSSHRLRQIASMFDSTGDTTADEKLSKVIVPQYPTCASARKNPA